MRRLCLHSLLILMMLASGIVTAAQNVLHIEIHEASNSLHHSDDWHAHEHSHHDLHHAVVIEGASDEHGDHFHVHVPLCAVVAADVVDASPLKPALQLSHFGKAPLSLTYAPPVPPPNA